MGSTSSVWSSITVPAGGRGLYGSSGCETSRTGDDVGNLPPIHHAGESLIEVSVSREHSIRPQPRCFAAVVDILHQAGGATRLGVHRKRWVMDGDDDGTFSSHTIRL